MTTEDTVRIRTGLGMAERDRVVVRGYDLTEELLGNITFTGMFSLILRGRPSSPADNRMLDALLVVLVEHGMVSPVVNARFVYGNAPEALQAAVAASLLGAGSVHLGSSEWCARMLQEAIAPGASAEDVERTAEEIVTSYREQRQRIAGIGHHTHPEGDPRAERLFLIAEETGNDGTYCQLLRRIAILAGERRGKTTPVNVTGAIGAIASDMGFDWRITKAFALVGRTLGALGHIQEEMHEPISDQIRELIQSHLEYTAQPRRWAESGETLEVG